MELWKVNTDMQMSAPFLENKIYQVTSFTSNTYVHSGSTLDIAICSSSCKIGAISS